MIAVKSTMTPMLMKNQVELSFLKPRSVTLSFCSFFFSSSVRATLRLSVSGRKALSTYLRRNSGGGVGGGGGGGHGGGGGGGGGNASCSQSGVSAETAARMLGAGALGAAAGGSRG